MLNKVKARKGALMGVLLWAFLSDALANQLQDVSFSALPGNRVEIVLTTTDPVVEPTSLSVPLAKALGNMSGRKPGVKIKLRRGRIMRVVMSASFQVMPIRTLGN